MSSFFGVSPDRPARKKASPYRIIPPSMIELKDIEVRFGSKGHEVHAVRGVSLEIETGMSYGIVGTSGAGKSTLMRTINLLQRPSSGTVAVDGIELGSLPEAELRAARSRIGMIFQHFNLFMRKTVYENVAFPLRISGAAKGEIESRVPELLRLVALEDKAQAYPAKLSGGQKQRVGIARALANRPSVLLCDEPTSALDNETTAQILGLLNDINRQLGITIVLISHEMSVIKQACRRVAVMTEGRVVEEGGIYDVFASPKHEYTRQLVESSFDLELPPRVLSGARGPILKITYRGGDAERPVLSEATEELGASFNILVGKIEYIDDKPLGLLVVEASSTRGAAGALSAGKLDEVLDYLRRRGVAVEVLRHEAP
jgi:D-methionine transport system ATP-binding protein